VNNLRCRLVATYDGLVTEWLLEDNIDRSRLGKGANGLPAATSGIMKIAMQYSWSMDKMSPY